MNGFILTAALLAISASGHAENLMHFSSDSLTRQIYFKSAQPGGGITAVVRLPSGQIVPFNIAEPTRVELAPAAKITNFSLKAAPGLEKKKPKKTKYRKYLRRALPELRRAETDTRWGR